MKNRFKEKDQCIEQLTQEKVSMQVGIYIYIYKKYLLLCNDDNILAVFSALVYVQIELTVFVC